MGCCSQDRVFPFRNRHLVISLLLFLAFASLFPHQPVFAQGRTPFEGRELIGSRPPRCEGRCSNCGHCEAIQVPIVPQQGFPRGHFVHSTPAIVYSRGDDLSNYKPMSWKCKCGDSIFNP